MDEYSNFSKNPWWWNIIIVSAIISFCAGLFILFFYHPVNSIFDSTLIGGFFSLSGVLLFAATLFYQIKEYKLQIKELRNSVIAQTKTSKTLEDQTILMQEQKAIMLEQKNNDLIISAFAAFNKYKSNEDLQERIIQYFEFLRSNILRAIDQQIIKVNPQFKYNSKDIAEFILSQLTESCEEKYYLMLYLKDYIQYGVNIIELIEEVKLPDVMIKWHRVSFHNQLTIKELLLIYISNLIDFKMPNSEYLKWTVPLLDDFLQITSMKDKCKINGNQMNEILNFIKEKEYKSLN